MASYNGLVAIAGTSLNGSTASSTIGSTGQLNVPVVAALPAKFFSDGQFGVVVSGISGTIGIQVIGSIAGATFVIAGRTGINANGGFPVPMITYVGSSGTFQNIGIPRPAFVSFQAAGLTAPISVTASVTLAARY